VSMHGHEGTEVTLAARMYGSQAYDLASPF
jgi:hypothetical protein